MDYKEFLTKLKEKVLKNKDWHLSEADYHFYPDGFTSADQKEKEIIYSTNIKYHNKESDVLEGDFVIIDIPGTTTDCRFSADYLYKAYKSDGWDCVQYIIDENIKIVTTTGVDQVIERLKDYEFTKERIIIRPLNYQNNRYELKNAVYKMCGDIALVLYIYLYNNKELGFGSVKIQKQLVEEWGKNLDEIWDTAMVNTNVMAPPRIYMNAGECFKPPYERGEFMLCGSKLQHIESLQVPVITTTQQINGAIAMFYPGVKEKLAEMFGKSYYVAFTSINDVRLHCEGTISPQSILQRIQLINSAFPEEEILSRKVFFYDKEKQTFETLDD